MLQLEVGGPDGRLALTLGALRLCGRQASLLPKADLPLIAQAPQDLGLEWSGGA